jgi:hypothetical protein
MPKRRTWETWLRPEKMKRHKLITFLVALLVMGIPAMAVFTGLDLDATLSNLRRELFVYTDGLNEAENPAHHYLRSGGLLRKRN